MYNPQLHFHFIGIGGVGMSGIAEILLGLGFRVSGSDAKLSEVTERLVRLGATIAKGHARENLPDAASLVVYSSAVSQENPEILKARDMGIPVVKRAEVLSELMRLKFGIGVAGSHGKTSTTSLIGTILESAKLDPTVIIGGQVKSFGTGGKLGKGEYLVAETDESDRSFLLLRPTIAVVTNIDREHIDAYESEEHLERSFAQFIESVPFYGLAVLCEDDPTVKKLAESYSRRKITYGFSESAQIRADNIVAGSEGMSFTVSLPDAKSFEVFLPMLGRHFVLNSLAAIAVARELSIPMETITAAIGAFSGVKRRLEFIAEVDGVKIFNDYGHHPVEVAATISALRECMQPGLKKLHVIFQPHRYSRTRQCWDEFLRAFKDADSLITTEIYSAGEEAIPGITGKALATAIEHTDKKFATELDEAIEMLSQRVSSGDIVLCLGAGSVGSVPAKLAEVLQNSSLSERSSAQSFSVKDELTTEAS